MKLSKDETIQVSKLANLPIDEDAQKYAGQLSVVLDYIDQLNQVDVSGIEPTYNISGNENVFRKDEAGECLGVEDALSNAKNIKNGFFVTKGVFEQE